MAANAVPTTVSIRSPSAHTLAGAKNVKPPISPPTVEWMSGTWHVTHSTLSMWKDRFGVRITYTPLSSSIRKEKKAFPNLKDVVEYQNTPGGRYSSVNGVSRSVTVPDLGTGWAFSWRGKGLLMIANSQWEVLGYGTDLSGASSDAEGQGRDWIVTYFGETIFTPAGIDIYCRSEDGVSAECLEAIKAELAKFERPSLKRLSTELFAIPRK
ncbi:uncharacterized protein PV09_07904 [Verruconis gallopava]|uniref:Uncharacterized protein n=1 Tax=Verruconis gallopava TaxID=253628 RepID=A0A0D2AN60_9PEZI|nr:uncharacterized protein PV09_07904 [Verruconis gallopava]KIW00549.1 hypothetical protein PV09_07904 [Verruconis gallopava]